MTRRALLSVYEKNNLTDFAAGVAELGFELVASGGTARALAAGGLAVLEVADVTRAPEMLGGRVKTLHPAIHAGILARDIHTDRADLVAHGIEPTELLVCTLYPFEQTAARPGATLPEAVEQIDIGGVTLLRAAAKNFERVTVVCDPADYDQVLGELRRQGAVCEATRRQLAVKAFAHTRDYDTAIAAYLAGSAASEPQPAVPLPAHLTLELVREAALRYGENPHQAAALYGTAAGAGPLGGELLQGKALSYNNLLDLDAAWAAAISYDEPAVVIVKHLSPCGLAVGDDLAAAFPLALASDPVSAFGGVIAANRTVDGAFAAALAAADLFVEGVIAPDFTPQARDWFAAHKKNCRLVAAGEGEAGGLEMRSVRGGFLVQETDRGDPLAAEWRVVSRRQPTEAEWRAMRFGWTAARHVKSNAIVFAVENATVGIGGGLPSRVDAVRLAATKAGQRARGAVMASDAFFPFSDGLEAAAAAGVTAVVEPGGSVRDEEIIAAADRLDVALVFTGARHFRH